jgi:hypothetical protein
MFAVTFSAGGFTNELHRRELLTNAPTHRPLSPGSHGRLGYIPTNSLAFREYALETLLAQANLCNRKLALGLPNPITSDQVTVLTSIPTLTGLAGGITVLGRYRFGISDQRFTTYFDNQELTDTDNKLTKMTALKVASDFLIGLNLGDQTNRLSQMPEIEQRSYTDEEERMHLLPRYFIHWKNTRVQVEVSGITKRVVSYSNLDAPKTIPVPTNYYQMLGISPDRTTWGRQFGYDPLDTDAFRAFARQFITDRLNELIKAWTLQARAVRTNDITWFIAHPRLNDFDVSARFNNDRFHLQFGEGRITLFSDDAFDQSSFTGELEKFRAGVARTNILNGREAEAIARHALGRASVDLKKLQVREPPKVTQVEMAFDPGDKDQQLPLFDVFWSPSKEDPAHGVIDPAIGVQVSGATATVVMFANNSTLTPKYPLPTNYLALVGVVKRADK